MKKFFTLVSAFLLSVSLFASEGRPSSTLTIRSEANDNIKVVMDGKMFDPSTNSVIIQGIDNGYHDVKIYRQRGRMFTRRFELVYDDEVNVNRRTNLYVTIDRSGRVSMQESKIMNNDRDDYDDRGGDRGYSKAMSDREFSRVLQSIQKEWLESNKMESVKQITRNNYLSSSQVKEMMMLFNFESNKLDVAKSAFNNTVDKRNYVMVMDALSFSSSRKELQDYIRRNSMDDRNRTRY